MERLQQLLLPQPATVVVVDVLKQPLGLQRNGTLHYWLPSMLPCLAWRMALVVQVSLYQLAGQHSWAQHRNPPVGAVVDELQQRPQRSSGGCVCGASLLSRRPTRSRRLRRPWPRAI